MLTILPSKISFDFGSMSLNSPNVRTGKLGSLGEDGKKVREKEMVREVVHGARCESSPSFVRLNAFTPFPAIPANYHETSASITPRE